MLVASDVKFAAEEAGRMFEALGVGDRWAATTATGRGWLDPASGEDEPALRAWFAIWCRSQEIPMALVTPVDGVRLHLALTAVITDDQLSAVGIEAARLLFSEWGLTADDERATRIDADLAEIVCDEESLPIIIRGFRNLLRDRAHVAPSIRREGHTIADKGDCDRCHGPLGGRRVVLRVDVEPTSGPRAVIVVCPGCSRSFQSWLTDGFAPDAPEARRDALAPADDPTH
jgi:hypothetical protein